MKLGALSTVFLAVTLLGCMQKSAEQSAREVPILAAAMYCDAAGLRELTTDATPEDFARTAPEDSQGRPALHWAIEKGCEAGVDILLEAGADPNLAAGSDHSFGATPLNWASFHSQPKMVKSLLAHGADLHVRGGRARQSPMFGAAGSGSSEVVQILLDEGLDASERDHSGTMPLHYGARFPEVVRILLAHGADINARNRYGVTPLMWLRSHEESDQGRVEESLHLLLAEGADLHARNRGGETALFSAVQMDDVFTLRLLLEAGADVNAEDQSGRTPLAILRERRQQKKDWNGGFVYTILRMVLSEIREHEEAEMAKFDEVESVLVEAGGRV